MTSHLYPPLEYIRNELFQAEPSPLSEDTEALDEDPRWEALAREPLPDYLDDLIRRHTAAVEAHAPAPLAVGQIRCLNTIPGQQAPLRSLSRSFGVLLGAHIDGKVWSGWLVAQEVDYATDRDLVIEEDDGPVDPVAGMVQTWNPVRVVLEGNERILGKLPPLRMATVMALAEAEIPGGGADPRPGKVYGWDLAEGIVALTGTPLGGADDPRTQYRVLYQQLAAEIVAATQPTTAREVAPQAATGIWAWLQQTFVRPAWTFGAIACSIVLAMLQAVGPTMVGQTASLQVISPAAARTFEIRLDETRSVENLRPLLTELPQARAEVRFDGKETVVAVTLPPTIKLRDEDFLAMVERHASGARVTKSVR